MVFLVLYITTALALQCYTEDNTSLQRSKLVYVDATAGEDDKSVFDLIAQGKLTDLEALPGSKKHPFRTLEFAYDATDKLNDAGAGFTGVALSKGYYLLKNPLSLLPGISIYGSFSGIDGWKRDPSYVTEIAAGFEHGIDYPTVISKNIVVPTAVEDVTIIARDATGVCCSFKSGSSIAFYADKSPALVLRRVNLKSGNGADAPAVNNEQQNKGIEKSDRAKDGENGLSSQLSFTTVGFQPTKATDGENGYDKYTIDSEREDFGGKGGKGGISGGASFGLYIVGDQSTFPLLQFINFENGRGGKASQGTPGFFSEKGLAGKGGNGGNGINGPSYNIFSLGSPITILGTSKSETFLDGQIVYQLADGALHKFAFEPIPSSIKCTGIQTATTQRPTPQLSSTDLNIDHEVSILSAISIILACIVVGLFAFWTEKQFTHYNQLNDNCIA